MIGRYLDSGTGQCVFCGSKTTGCVECEVTTGVCTKCNLNMRLDVGGTKKCYPKCMENEYELSATQCRKCSDVLENCLKCGLVEGNEQCLECVQGFFYDENKKICQKNCGFNQAWVTPNDCTSCSNNCQNCKNETVVCEKCELGYNLQEKNSDFFKEFSIECQINCQKTESWILPNNCKMCDINCLECERTKLACKNCLEGYFANSTFQCQKKCQKKKGGYGRIIAIIAQRGVFYVKMSHWSAWI